MTAGRPWTAELAEPPDFRFLPDKVRRPAAWPDMRRRAGASVTEMRSEWSFAFWSALALGRCAPEAVSGEPVARPSPYAGAVIAAKGGEKLKFPTEASWRYVEPAQNLVGGDTIRTNALGKVAILFEDRTQVRVGHNSTLIVKDIARGPNGETLLSLPSGSIYARASRGGAGVRIETPAAAAAIRGTDWSLSVQGSKTALAVLEGASLLNLFDRKYDVIISIPGEGRTLTASARLCW